MYFPEQGTERGRIMIMRERASVPLLIVVPIKLLESILSVVGRVRELPFRMMQFVPDLTAAVPFLIIQSVPTSIFVWILLSPVMQHVQECVTILPFQVMQFVPDGIVLRGPFQVIRYVPAADVMGPLILKMLVAPAATVVRLVRELA